MLVIPKSLKPKLRKDLNHLNKEFFESLWVSTNITSDAANKCKQLINISYNSEKYPFLEELSTSIDFVVTENKQMILIGDFNIDCFKTKAKTLPGIRYRDLWSNHCQYGTSDSSTGNFKNTY